MQTESTQDRKPRSAAPLPADLAAERRLKLAEVSAITGLGRTWIYAALGRGEFPQPTRHGLRCTRWRAGDVLAWLEQRGQK